VQGSVVAQEVSGHAAAMLQQQGAVSIGSLGVGSRGLDEGDGWIVAEAEEECE